ncbi:MAG: UvrD-helicase domain-containing protein [Oscillospiraceae bacterium]|jgi:ATP-dependent helicase/nuclease subunit A|nr:UvrD-helicase domain-containing protein [Oscillospiraceae bacterium]
MKEWTNEQKNAISSHDEFTLISAAAGSGKTAVLVERVIKLICEGKREADKFLIVTFTVAAAAEMKKRIIKRLNQKIDENPLDEKLRRQKSLFFDSFIGTISSFCAEIVRENFEKSGVSPKFRIADEEEMVILKETAINNILENIYQINDPNFIYVIEFFSDEKSDEKFAEIIIKIYRELSSCIDKIDFFKKTLNNFKISFENTPSGKFIINFIKENLNFAFEAISKAVFAADNNENAKKAYMNALKEDLNSLDLIINEILENNLNNFKIKIENFTFSKFKPLKGEEEIKEEINFLRNCAKISVEKIKKAICDISFVKQDSRKMFKIAEIIFKTAEMFEKELTKLKTEKNILDFSDLERLTLKILINRDKTKSKTAFDIGARFEEIMIDEYQDVNEIQDEIFSLISNNRKNLFIVGDPKQSIYGFRGSNPLFFTDKYEKGNLIFLNKNFRSSSNIVDFVNLIFEKLLNKEMCGIDYKESEKLRIGSDYQKKLNERVDFFILEKNKDEIENEKAKEGTKKEIKEETKFEKEAEFVSETIQNMIQNNFKIREKSGIFRTAEYKDFCILLRSTDNHGIVYENALKKRGISVNSRISEKFFKTPEVQIMLSFLRVIDNPIQDIPIISVLMSPVFGFTVNDLAEIRLCAQKEIPIYFALKEKSVGNSELSKRCALVLKKIEDLRILSATTSIDKFINLLINEMSFIAISVSISEGRSENIRYFSFLAQKYENKDNRSFSKFVSFLEKIEKKNNIPSLCATPAANSVNLMSIHQSKGLEFPICIISDCSRDFFEEKDELIIDSKLGIGFYLKNSEFTIKLNNIYQRALKFELKKEKISEELRILYVALTRASTKLIITAYANDINKLIKESKQKQEFISNGKIHPFFVKNAKNFAEWLLISGIIPSKICFENRKKLENSCITTKPLAFDNVLFEKIKSRLDFVYDNSESVPLKIAASSLNKILGKYKNNKFYINSAPEFIQGMSPEKIGTAIHEFLHFANFENILNNFNGEILALIKKGYLTKKQADVLEENIFRKFLTSDLGKRILKSKTVFREYRFSIRASCIGIKSDTIIQGSIDCAFEEPEGFVIVDYKSDKISCDENIITKYQNQLEIYKKSFEICQNTHVKELAIYSFANGRSIRIPLEPVFKRIKTPNFQ